MSYYIFSLSYLTKLRLYIQQMCCSLFALGRKERENWVRNSKEEPAAERRT